VLPIFEPRRKWRFFGHFSPNTTGVGAENQPKWP
jgi:hypothetical protein